MRKNPSIRSSSDFQQVFARGRSARRNGLTVYVHTRADAGPARLGLAVRARPDGAVVRNRIRRRLRAAFHECVARPGVDVVIRADRTVAEGDFARLRRDLAEALEAAGGAP